MKWSVSSKTDLQAIAWQSGVPVEQLLMGVDPRTGYGEVEADTRGEAIVKAHQRFPYIKVEDLGVVPIHEGTTTDSTTSEISPAAEAPTDGA